MLYVKRTLGFVKQTFNDAGECIKQQFYAGDEVDFETDEGMPINSGNMPLGGREYFVFEMVQPEVEESLTTDDRIPKIRPKQKKL